MISINIKGSGSVSATLASVPRQASRAIETALDATAKEIKDEIKTTMKSVFDNPTPWTLNSLKVTTTKGHNMIAKVGFKEPDRMQQHYLVPMVEGGVRKRKGFELAVGDGQYDLAVGAKRMKSTGNITVNQAKAIVSGVKSNQGDYVVLKSARNGLMPGVYQRVNSRSRARRASLSQRGKRKGTVIRARGLKPILIKSQPKRYKQRLDFYGIAHRVHAQRFEPLFWSNLNRFLSR